jgi:RNA polymerase sigma factor (sigma-70 family)
MAKLRVHALADPIQALFGPGTMAGFSDGQLLERFLSPGDSAGELAFEALVMRHGPMVMRVCRSILNDPDAAHDAFQAAFLVLARRGHAIRDRRSVASWLYGVAARVAMRCRSTAIGRHIRDRRAIAAAKTNAADQFNQETQSTLEFEETAHAVHTEVNRLPEKYRAPIVLCYLEGLTHDEAAARLSWPVGTVRSRLARARDTLRARLTRRGITSNTTLAPVSGRLANDTAQAMLQETIPRELSTSIARAVSHLVTGGSSSTAAFSTHSLTLAQGVLKAMTLKKLLFFASAALPLFLISLGGGVLIAQKLHAQDPKPITLRPADTSPAAQPNESPQQSAIDHLRQRVLEAAQARLDAVKAYYDEGRITIDRYLDANKQYQLAEVTAARTDSERLAAMQRYVNRLVDIERREKSELDEGRATVADLAEATYRRTEAQLDFELARTGTAGAASILARLSDLERKVDRLQKAANAR